MTNSTPTYRVKLSPQELDIVLMKDYEDQILHHLGTERRTVLYLAASDNKSQGFFSFMVPPEKVGDYLKTSGWEHNPGDLQPAFCTSSKGVTYDRLGHNDGVEPIIHVRGQMADNVVELTEEFRLLYELFQNAAGEIFRWNETGHKDVIGIVTSTKVEIQTRLIRQFLAVKGKCLAVGFHHRRSFAFATSAVPKAKRARKFANEDVYLNFWLTDMMMGSADEEAKTVAVIAGKKIIRPLPIEDCGIPPYTRSHKRLYESFIVGQTNDGEDILYSCAPDGLSDSFGGNPGLPHYLAEICFRREVLSQYLNHTDKYSVGDGVVSCIGFWQLRVDNDGSEWVFAFLGDLGKIPHAEQLHWKQFNIPKSGEVSSTARARNFNGEFADATSAELVFKQELSELEKLWEEKHGWPLFLPFVEEDSHVLESLHVPPVSDQGNFDRQTLNLAKILVDRLNLKRLTDTCAVAPKEPGSINALEKYVDERQLVAVKEKLPIVRDIQLLRSSGAAHHKGSRYEQHAKKLGLTKETLIVTFQTLLRRSIDLILALKSTL